jgi:TonB family protein
MKANSFLLLLLLLLLGKIAQAQTGENPLPYAPPPASYDTAPRYVGGDTALFQYIKDSLRYPQPEKSKHLQGTVQLKFIITPQGQVINIVPLNGVPNAPNFVKEAMRLIASMPPWLPATKGGQAVPADYYLGVPFKLK